MKALTRGRRDRVIHGQRRQPGVRPRPGMSGFNRSGTPVPVIAPHDRGAF